MLSAADPLEVGDGGTRRRGRGLRIEEAVTAPAEGLARAPDVEEGELAGPGPAEDVACRGDDRVGETLHI